MRNLRGHEIIPRGAVVYIATDDPEGVCRGCLSNRQPCPRGEAAKSMPGCPVDPSWDAMQKPTRV